jgi:flagellar protein FliO/FliZ
MSFADFARAIFALILVLGLIGLAAYGMRRFGPEWMVRLQQQPRTARRLTIIESLPLDPVRRLVLVRLDGVERLLLLGEGRELAEVPLAAMAPKRETIA